MSSARAKRRQKRRAVLGAVAGIPLLIVIAYAISSNDAVESTRRGSVASPSSALVEGAVSQASEGASGVAASVSKGIPSTSNNGDRVAMVSADLVASVAEDEESALHELLLIEPVPGSNDERFDQLNDLAVFGAANPGRGFRGGAGFINNHRAMRSAGRHSGSRFGGLGAGVGASGFGGGFAGFGGLNPQERTLGLGTAFDPVSAPLSGHDSGSVFEDIFEDTLEGSFEDNSITGLPFFPWEDPCAKDGLVVSPCFQIEIDPCAGVGDGELVVSPCYAPAAVLLAELDPPGSPPPPFVPFFNPPPPGNPPGDNPPPRNPPTPNDPPGPFDPPGPVDDPPTPVPLPGSAFLVGLGLAILRSKRNV